MSMKMGQFQGASIPKEQIKYLKKLGKMAKQKFKLFNKIIWKPEQIKSLKWFGKLIPENQRFQFGQFSVSNNHVTGIGLYKHRMKVLPDFISEFSMLEYLVINTGVLEYIPDTIGELKALKVLDFGTNMSITVIPDSIGNLKTLKSLFLDLTRIKNLPESVRNLRNLERLCLGNNNISEFPECIKELKSLKELTSYNSGTYEVPNISVIPDWIGELSSLEILHLGHNDISELPSSMANLQNLKELYLADNNLRMLPVWITELDSLNKVDIHGNEGIKISDEILMVLQEKGVEVVLKTPPNRSIVIPIG